MTGPILALLRHADYQQPANVPSAWLPYALNEQGVEQAQQAAGYIRRFMDTHSLTLSPVIDSSHMLRAWQTSSILGAALGLSDIEETERLAERSVGAMANLTTMEIEKLLDDDPRYDSAPTGWKSSTDYRLPFQGAESLSEAGMRVADHIRLVEQQTPAGQLRIIVGHGASMRHAAMHLGLLSRDGVASVSMYHARPVFIRRTGDHWEHVDGEWKPRAKTEKSDEFSTA